MRQRPVDDLARVAESTYVPWCERAARVVKKIDEKVDRGEAIVPDDYSKDWGAAKKSLKAAYGKTCAYCEYDLSGGSHGRVEHYRPKGRVRIIVNETRTVLVDENDSPHPGYWWTLLDWDNLIVICEVCNTHKSDVFPVAAKHQFLPPDDRSFAVIQELEAPLVLHPVYDSPEEHLTANAAGVLISMSERARETITVCKLNREELCDARRQAQRSAERQMRWAISESLEAVEREYRRLTAPSERYSLAVKAHLDRLVAEGSLGS